MKTTSFFLIVLLTACASPGEKANCKLTIRTLETSGREKVEVTEVHALDRDDCKQQAKAHEVITSGKQNVRASYSWRGE